ncbi:hypothetical protein [Gloeobacter kilaueensis]|uniref:Uncharacterized protein n=1 Tax=Gloeobacter kilaueensis (strain ATCC BAA-2537 / CCAP 1431/1 / ULC 316 / JS1) TaxID=1183438 RepID=U5QPE6_GLOK1|nr:hypothetical protein [Gloeobacter kilaueensis]AGY59550.1 hypothetical protein GKIL_3304 [Gloeobacter kilaueensis JS1]
MNRSLLSLAVVGLVSATGAFLPVQAQQYSDYEYNRGNNNSRQFNLGVARLAPGTTISVAPTTDQGTLYLNTDKSYPYSLIVAEDVYDGNGNVALPAGSEVRGTFRPAKGGLRFFADSANINGRFYTLRASSKTLKDVKDPRYQGGGKIAGDAAIGAAGGALLGWALGNPGLGAIAGGVGGAAIGNVTAPQVVVVDDNSPIDLRLEAPLSLRY